MAEKLNQTVSTDTFLPAKSGVSKGLQEAGKEILRVLKQQRPRRINNYQHTKAGFSKIPPSVDEETVYRLLTSVDEIGQGEIGINEKEKLKPKSTQHPHTGGYNCKCGNCKVNVLDEDHFHKLLSKVQPRASRSTTSSTSESLYSSSSFFNIKGKQKSIFERLAEPKIKKTTSNMENKNFHYNKWSISDRLDELSKPKLKKERSEPIILRSLPQIQQEYNRIPLSRIEELAIPRQKIDLDLQITPKPIYKRDYKCPSRIQELAQPKVSTTKFSYGYESIKKGTISETKLTQRISELSKPKNQGQKKKYADKTKRWNI